MWFILHFEMTSKTFENCEKCIYKLKKFLKDYDKTQEFYTKQGKDIYSRLKPNLKKAIENAQSLGELADNDPEKSVCEMYKIFNEISNLIDPNPSEA